MHKGKLLAILVSVVFLLSISVVHAANVAGCKISGKITNLKLEPIEGATVLVEVSGKSNMAKTVLTDGMGNFTVNMPVAGIHYSITVSKEGFKSNRIRMWASSDEKYDSRNIQLEPTVFPISGKITNKSGEPIAGAKVSFEQNGGQHGIQTAISDENGNYLSAIPNQGVTYWVVVSKEGYKSFRGKIWASSENVMNKVLEEE